METPTIYNTQTMLSAIDVRKAYEMTMFLTRKFFSASLDKINDAIMTIDIVKGSRKIAAYQSHKIAGDPATKNTYATQQLEPPTLCPYYDIDIDDILLRLPGQSPYASKSPLERAAEKLGWYNWDLIQMIYRRIEASARECLLTGKVTFTGKGVAREIDYQRHGDNDETLSGAALWSASTADPLGDLERWRDITAENGGRRADFCFMGSSAWNAFRSHDKVLKQLDNRRMMFGSLSGSMPDSGLPKNVDYRGNVDGLDIFTYTEWYIDPDTGLSTPYVPAVNVILGSSEAENHLYYGLVKTDVEAGPVPVPLLPRTWVEKKPSVRYLEMGSSPLIGMQEPDTTFLADVVAS